VNIHNAITTIDAGFEPDPCGMIDVIGTTADGRAVDLWITNDGSGPVIHPGASFLPYGGVYFNPLLVSVTEA
jgi:hypothetical protein